MKKSLVIKKLTIVFLLVAVAFGQKSDLKNVKVLPFKEKRELVSYMKTITKELGVKCSFCHIPNDYTSDKKANKIVAREMIKMTQNANSVMANLNFKEVSCWTCHRGNKIPERSPFKMS